MSAEAAMAVRWWQVGGYRCRLTVQRPKPGALVNATLEWFPSTPKRLTEDELRIYRSGRNDALMAISEELGGLNVAVLEV